MRFEVPYSTKPGDKKPGAKYLLRLAKTRGPASGVEHSKWSTRQVGGSRGYLWILDLEGEDLPDQPVLEIEASLERPDIAGLVALPDSESAQAEDEAARREDAKQTWSRVEGRLQEIETLYAKDADRLGNAPADARRLARRFFLKYDVLTTPASIEYLNDTEAYEPPESALVRAFLERRPRADFPGDLLMRMAEHLQAQIFRRTWAYFTLQSDHTLHDFRPDVKYHHLSDFSYADAVRQLSAYQLEVFRELDGGAAGSPLSEQLREAFALFANGALKYEIENATDGPEDPDFNGEPDSALFFTFAEFAQDAARLHPQEQLFWTGFAKELVGLQEVFGLRYRFAGDPREWGSYARLYSACTGALPVEAVEGIRDSTSAFVAKLMEAGLSEQQAISARMDENCLWAFSGNVNAAQRAQFHTTLRRAGTLLTKALHPDAPRTAGAPPSPADILATDPVLSQELCAVFENAAYNYM